MLSKLGVSWRECRTALLLTTLLVVAVPVHAQVGGVILGTVVDDQGGVLPGVTFTLTNADTGVVRTAVSETDGQYRLAGLQPAAYALKAELTGFRTVAVERLTVTIGLELRQDLKMQVQSFQETVTVSGEAPVIEVTRAEVAQVITQEQIDTLPMADRQPASLVLLLPGTNMDNTQVRRSQANIGAGQINNQMNAYFVDGSENRSPNSGQQHAEMPQLAIREFKVNIAQASAEHGGNVAGLISTATKSGTNRFSGEVLEYFKDRSLNAVTRDQLRVGTGKPDYRRYQTGLGIGGPIVQGRAHFFGAVELLTENRSFTVNSGLPQFYSALHGTFPTNYLRRKYFGRVDVQLNESQQLFFRYGLDWERIDCESCGGTNAAFQGSYVESPRDTAVTGHNWVINSQTLNELRVQWPARLRNQTGPPGTPLWNSPGEFPQERISVLTPVYNFPSMHWGSTTASIQWTDRFELKDDFSYSRGAHNWKFGGATERFTSPEDAPPNVGTWTFSQDQLFDGSAAAIASLRSPITFTASFPGNSRNLLQQWFNAYIQDEWRPLPNLTLNLGVRYDIQFRSLNYYFDFTGRERLRELIDPTTRGENNNFAPRLGLAWDINDGQTVARLAYGRFFNYIAGGSLRGEADTLKQSSVSITNPSYPDPYGGLSPQAFVTASARPNVSILDDNIKNGYGDTVTAGVSRQLRPSLALHVDGVFTNLRQLSRTQNINQPVPVYDFKTLTAAQAVTITSFTAAQLNARRPLATWGNITQLASSGWHDYRALYVRLDKRFADNYQYILSYTREWTRNNVANITDFYHPELNEGPSGRKHTLVASGSARLPFGLTAGAVWTIRTALPYDASSNVDLTGDGTVDPVPGVTTNMGGRDKNGTARLLELVNEWRTARRLAPIPASQLESSNANRVDVRVSRAFTIGDTRSVEISAQVLNLFGRDNLIGGTGGAFNNNSLSDAFGTYSVAGARQEAELGIRFKF
jgi:outer membrane receptor protein involved in Fe transport